MKLEVRKMSEDITYVGYFSKEYTEYVEVIRCWDRDFTGELRKFYRVDFSYRTVSTLNRTKAEALSYAKKYMRFKKDQDMAYRKIMQDK